MKVIDLLNKIANGEIPKKIMIDDMLYTHDGVDYKRKSDGQYLFTAFLETTTEDFNREVEIIEEDKKIEENKKIENNFQHIYYSENALTNINFKNIRTTLTNIIKVINEMRKDK